MSEEIEMILLEAGEKMDAAVAHAKRDFAGVRTGRATPALVDKLQVEYYGSDVPLQQLASFSVPEARQLIITPFDKGAMEAIEKAIQNSDLGLMPSNDGVILRLNFPPLTADRRKDLVKVVKNMAEDGRIALRNTRRSARQDLDQLGDTSEDDIERAEKQLDGITQGHEAAITEALDAKVEELLEV